LEALEALGSPIGAFVQERCIVEPGQRIIPQALFNAWRRWCEAQNRQHPGTVHSFGRDLRAAVPGLRFSQPRDRFTGVQVRHYEGIDLRKVAE
jgi:putative DNA primase/helicase